MRRALSIALVLCAAPVGAQLAPPGPAVGPPGSPVAAELRMRRAIHRGGMPAAALMADEADGAAVWIGTRRPLSESDAAQLDRLGARLDRALDGALPRGTVHRAFVCWSALDAVAVHPLVERVEPARPAIALRPLETIGAEQGTTRAHLRPDDGVTGVGATVAAIDSPIDVGHPHFFHADGGIYDWVDRDDSGDFSAGDAVALEGTVAPLIVFDAGYFDPLIDPAEWQNLDDRLDPGLDWLFADLDGDGRRGVGADQGFTDDDPALGEPLFVAHDADGDGRLTPDERLFRLGTSKVRQVTIGPRTWSRGVDLVEAVDAARREDASHATGVASILLGGQPGLHRRVGLAPGAEYVGYAAGQEGPMPFADAARLGATIFLHEWSQPAGEPGDGGSLFERAMDEARADGMLQVCPLGNLNGAEKQIERAAEAGAPTRFEFVVDEGFFDGQSTRPYSAVVMHLAWTADVAPSALRWIGPDGQSAPMLTDGEARRLGAMAYSAGLDRTARGTRWLLVYFWNPDGAGLTEGRWGIELEGLPGGTPVHGRITDDVSGWSVGVAWVGATDDRTSLTFPSTADSAIGVAAFGGRMDFGPGWGGVGELRGYSGRGPRIDGAPVVDIAAPDDPLAALASSALPEFPRGHSALFAPFGGTSGAGPHVAAALALYAERFPEWDADALEAHLLGTTETAGLVPDLGPLPNDGWGFGKLLVNGGLYGESPPQNDAPSATGLTFDGETIAVRDPRDPEGDPLRYRLDLGYDGQWDGPWQAEPRFDLPADRFSPGDEFVARVAIRDVFGGSTERIATFALTALDPDSGPPDAGPTDMGPPDGGASEGDGGVVVLGEDAGVVVIGGDDDSSGGGGGGGFVGCRATPGIPGGGWLGLVFAAGFAVLRRRR